MEVWGPGKGLMRSLLPPNTRKADHVTVSELQGKLGISVLTTSLGRQDVRDFYRHRTVMGSHDVTDAPCT